MRASNLVHPERATVALAGGWTSDARRSFGGACAAAAAAFGGDRTAAACEPEDAPERFDGEDSDANAPFSSRPTKKAKTKRDEEEEEIRHHRRRFEHAEGRAGVVIAGVGAAAGPGPGTGQGQGPAWSAYSDAARRLRSAGVAAGPSPFGPSARA